MNTGLRRIAVVGAGLGGLAAAARLAHHGFEVDLYEQADEPGGRCRQLTQDGFRWDVGPTVLLMPEVIEETFAALGRRLADYVTLERCHPNYRIHFHDGSALTLTSSREELAREVEAIEPGASRRLGELLEASKEMYRESLSRFVGRNFDHLGQFFTPANLRSMVRIGALQKLYPFIARYFGDERLRAAFTFQTMYLGISPYDAPAVFGLLTHAELGVGIYYPRSGLHALPLALERVAREEGVRFHYRSRVEKVLTQTGRTKGLRLEDGSKVEADAVVCNADLPWAYAHLLGESVPRPRGAALRYTSSAYCLYLGLDRCYPALLRHNVFLGREYRQSFEEIFHRRRVPEELSFYVNVPSRGDAAAAPPGRDALYVLVPVPHLVPGIEWDQEAPRLRARVFRRLAEEGYPELERHVVAERQLTPKDWEESFSLAKGAAFGLAHDFLQIGPFRPSNQHARIRNLFFVGASTQPGTGLPTVLLSARLTVERVLQESARVERALVREGYRAAKRIARSHARSFYFASALLFGARRRAAFALYACCRRLDDLVDEGQTPELPARLMRARAAISSLYRAHFALADPRWAKPERRHDEAAPPWSAAEHAALADTVARFGIPEAPFQDLISGMEMDLTRSRYESFAELDLYCHRVAGTVGLLLLPVLGAQDPRAAEPAADLGKAMQLTNILRDVREDFERGRVYLPRNELAAFGIDEDQLRRGDTGPRFQAFMGSQVARARELYVRAASGLSFLRAPGTVRMVRLMAVLYGGILDDIERRGHDVFSARAHVPLRRKLWLALGVLLRRREPDARPAPSAPVEQRSVS